MSDGASPASSPGAAYYAQPRLLTRPRAREWWTVLHPPYTLWHLSYVVIGACLAAPVNATTLIATVLAFFLAVGLGAHALDELQGRPLGTTMPAWQLVAAAVIGVTAAVALGVVGLFRSSPYLAIFIGVGVVLVVGYNLELFGGRLHTNASFALGWGGFPLVTAGFAQHGRLSWALVVAGLFATFLAQAQRQLSTPARDLRRRTRNVSGAWERTDGTRLDVTVDTLRVPLEGALRSLGWSIDSLAVALLLLRFLH